MPFIKKTLDSILGEERANRFVNSQPYKFCLETFVMNSFSYIVTAPIELGIAGMDVSEHLATRAVAAVTNTIMARPYGILRDYVFRKMNITKESSFFKKYAGDTVAFMATLPVGWINLMIAGAELNEIISYTATVIPIIGFCGRPYGAYLDFMRKQSGIILGHADNKSTSTSHTSGTEDKNT